MLAHFNCQPLPPFFVRAPARFIYIRLTAEIVESLLQAAARVFANRRVLRSGRAGPTSRGREMLRISTGSLYPVLWPRAGGNLIQTRNTRLNDFLLQHSRAVEL